jgi:hypothetical protein
MTIGFHGHDHILTIGTNNINTALPITASNLKDDNETRLKASETKISNHETRLQTAETKINNHDTTIQTIETTLSNHETRLKVVEHDSKEHSETLSNHENRLNTIENKIVDDVNKMVNYRVKTIQGESGTRIEFGQSFTGIVPANSFQYSYINIVDGWIEIALIQCEEFTPDIFIANSDGNCIDCKPYLESGISLQSQYNNITGTRYWVTYPSQCRLNLSNLPILVGKQNDTFKIHIDCSDPNKEKDIYKLLELKVEPVSTESIRKPLDSSLLTLGGLRELLYPIGSIYTSMNNINPSTFIGGTWEQIVDRFLYCSNSSLETGGSKKITVAQLPAHSHSITELDIRGNEDGSNQYTIAKYGGNDTTITTGNTGSGQDYMPEYMTVFAWYRTA